MQPLKASEPIKLCTTDITILEITSECPEVLFPKKSESKPNLREHKTKVPKLKANQGAGNSQKKTH